MALRGLLSAAERTQNGRSDTAAGVRRPTISAGIPSSNLSRRGCRTMN